MIFKNGFNGFSSPLVGSVATFEFVYSSISVYIIICARVRAMWVSTTHSLLFLIKILSNANSLWKTKKLDGMQKVLQLSPYISIYIYIY